MGKIHREFDYQQRPSTPEWQKNAERLWGDRPIPNERQRLERLAREAKDKKKGEKHE
jgi:hypothetical protein